MGDEAVDRDPRVVAVGAELRAIRERLRWSQPQAVERVNAASGTDIGKATLLTYEHGTRAMPLSRLFDLAATYGVPAPTILRAALRRLDEPTACSTCGRE